MDGLIAVGMDDAHKRFVRPTIEHFLFHTYKPLKTPECLHLLCASLQYAVTLTTDTSQSDCYQI